MYIDMEIKGLVDGGVVPGISYAIVDRQSSYIFTYGHKCLTPEKKPLGNTNIYDLASLTKVIATTTSILMLIDSGKLALDTTVKEVLPEFTHSEITIFHLLTHSSGLPSDVANRHSLTKTKLIESCFTATLAHKTGTFVEYSDIGFILLGLVVEHLSEGIETFARNNIFLPLSMNHTTYNPADKHLCVPTEITLERGFIQGIANDSKGFILGGVSGHAGLFSTIEDLCRFVKMLLNGGRHDQKVILKENTVKSLWRNYTEDLNTGRSLGWNLYGGDSVPNLMHTGFTGPAILIDGAKERGMILLTNRTYPDRGNTIYIEERKRLYDLFLNMPL